MICELCLKKDVTERKYKRKSGWEEGRKQNQERKLNTNFKLFRFPKVITFPV